MARGAVEGIKYTVWFILRNLQQVLWKINIGMKKSKPLRVAIMKIQVFWDFTVYHWISNYRIFEELQCVSEDLNFQM